MAIQRIGWMLTMCVSLPIVLLWMIVRRVKGDGEG